MRTVRLAGESGPAPAVPLSSRSQLGDGGVDDLFGHSMPAQAFDDPLDSGLLGEPFQILAQSLSDVVRIRG